ncbi:MAG: HlyD family efflux transporter periplasmic adaptor subunit [Saprospiraceae bacterium]|nr:HlyD family efflux transporter periplasmic adaptor subunit [Saprospiraceae bacterium]
MDQKIEKRTWTWQRIAILLIGLGAAAWLTTALLRDTGGAKLNVASERLLLDTVRRGEFQEFIPVTGIALPIRNVVLAANEGGKVEERFVEDGAMVTAGQAILRLSNTDLQLNYLNQEGSIVNQINQIQNMSLLRDQQSLNLRETLLDIEYRIGLTGQRLQRNKTLQQGGAVSKVEVDEMQEDYNNLLRRKSLLLKTIQKDSLSALIQERQMENSLDLMRRNLDIAKQSLENLVVKAPIEGQLSGLNTELGESISRGVQIAQIDDLSNFKIRVRIDEFYISRVFPDQVGTFTFAGKQYTLKIKKIYPQVVGGNFEADMLFVGEFPAAIKRGQTLSVKLELSAEEQATLLARGGFYQKTAGRWVYVLNKEGNAVKKSVQLGRQNPNFYEVLSGLQPGDVVITSGYDAFGDKDVLLLK